jgi:hypothetical protein
MAATQTVSGLWDRGMAPVSSGDIWRYGLGKAGQTVGPVYLIIPPRGLWSRALPAGGGRQ